MAVLERKLGFTQMTAINMIDMVGIGPFITLPIVISMMNGPWFLYAWMAGAVLAFVDAMVWSELGAAFPRAGGSYNFLRVAYGEKKGGKMMSFLFVWQTIFQAPLVIASAAIGFAGYFSYLIPLSILGRKALSGGVVILIVILLYRKIESIGKISIVLWGIVIVTLFWIIGGGIAHGNFLSPIRHINDGLHLNLALVAALGFASVNSVYSFLGYYNICHLGSEIKNPARNIPKSMFISIAGITVLYLLMNISVTSVIPWHNIVNMDVASRKVVVSKFIEVLMGSTAAKIVTILILMVAFSSVFSATLGYSRIPFAAAEDGEFFKVFARIHPKKHFPHISLLVLGALALVFSLLFKLETVIAAILAMRILIQFIGQAIGLLIARKRLGKKAFPYKMPLYPLPVFIAIGIWVFLFASTQYKLVIMAIVVIVVGLIIYLIKAKINRDWPFQNQK